MAHTSGGGPGGDPIFLVYVALITASGPLVTAVAYLIRVLRTPINRDQTPPEPPGEHHE